MNTRIVLADDQRLVREGLRRILESREDFTVVGEACDGAEAVRMIGETDPDVALIELVMSRFSGLRAIRDVKQASLRTRCIALSAGHTRGYVEDAFRAGAVGYVLKSSSSEDLLSSIDVVCSGSFYISPPIAQHLVEAAVRPSEVQQSAVHRLTGREREVLALIAEGLSSKEIASELGVSPKTADSHRSRLMEKIGIHKASGLVRFAIREGLVNP